VCNFTSQKFVPQEEWVSKPLMEVGPKAMAAMDDLPDLLKTTALYKYVCTPFLAWFYEKAL
jgi:hypothetical protein